MRSYRNRKGESVRVSEEHLDMAVRIKLELQKASPSRRCSWVQHRRLMEENGFLNSCNSENYRVLVKDYQDRIGELPDVEKHADMVADNKIEGIKGMVGELAYERRNAQNQFRKLNRVKREVIDKTLLVENVVQAFNEHDFSQLIFNYEPVESSPKKMVVGLSDLHIGSLVNLDDNQYNYSVAVGRMQEYLDKVVQEARHNDISDIYLMMLGDFIENPMMHNLAFTSEFNLQEQIVKASDIVIKFILGLADAGLNIKVAGVAGNHDRLTGNKKEALFGDNAMKLINELIKGFIDNSKISSVEYIETTKEYEHSFNVNGVNIKAVHGDLDRITDNNLLFKHSNIDGVVYDLMIMGHYHHFYYREVGVNQGVAVFGSLKGNDDYAFSHRLGSAPSQGLVIIDEDGSYEVKQIKLKHKFN